MSLLTESGGSQSNRIPDNFSSVMSSLVHEDGITSVVPSLKREGGTSLTESDAAFQSNDTPGNFVSVMSSLLYKGISSVMSSLTCEGQISENKEVQVVHRFVKPALQLNELITLSLSLFY